MPHDDLGIGARPGADTDRRDGEHVAHSSRKIGRHDLEDDRCRTCRLHGLGVANEHVAALAPALHSIAAEEVDRLRGESEVADDRNAGCCQCLDLWKNEGSALELHSVRAAVLHEDRGGVKCLRHRLLV